MQSISSFPEILTGKNQLGSYPMEKLKRVDEITAKAEISPIDTLI